MNNSSSSESSERFAGFVEHLGGFFTLWGGIAVLVACGLFYVGMERLLYAMKGGPREITAQDAASLSNNDFVSLTAGLDMNHGLEFEGTVTKSAFTLIPVKDTQNRLILFQAEHFVVPEGEPKPFIGRVVGPGLTGKWDLEGRQCDVKQQFRRKGVTLADDVLILMEGDVPRFYPWYTFLGIAAAVFLGVFAIRLYRGVRCLLGLD